MTPRPDRVFDHSVQHERTALAWERTGVALMVAGALMLKHASDSNIIWAEALGIFVISAGALTLPWAVRRYETLRRNMRLGADVTYSRVLGAVALVAVALSGGALVLVIVEVAS